MRRLIYFVILLSIIHLGVGSDADTGDEDEDEDHFDAGNVSPMSSSTIITSEPIKEDLVDNITESVLTTTTTTTIINEEIIKSYLTEYSLNVNRSSSSSDLTLNNHLNDSILLAIEDQKIFLISKSDGTTRQYFKDGNVIPIKSLNNLVIYDDETQELWIIDSTDQKSSKIPFKPKQIVVSPLQNNIWIAETADSLYISENSGINWKKIEGSSSSIILGWSHKPNSLVILQHSNYIKLLELTTLQTTTISNDVVSTKLFSRYLLVKRLNVSNSISISQVNNLGDNGFRALPKRLQSQGNFYCAVEDIHTEDLLLLFMTENGIGDNNETILSTCHLVSYSKQKSFSLSDIDCGRIRNESLLNTIECPKDQISFYQVQGLSKSVYIANIGSGPTTVVSFNDGVTWNKTQYECDKMMNCPSNASIVINSLTSSNDAPGIIFGKASDGVNEYAAISTNGGRQWRLNFKGNNYFTTVSNPSALLLAVPNVNEQTLKHSFRYSTDYGRHWREETFLNETSFQIVSLIADKNNIFYILTVNNQSQLNLIRLDFNLFIPQRCARYQLKEWSLHSACINGSKFYYQRRASGSHCLEESFQTRSQSCECSLADFECSPGYKRSSDGICLPKSHYIYSQDCTCDDNNTIRSTKRRGYVKSENSQCINGIGNYLSNTDVTRRDPNRPNFLLYGINSRTQRPTIEIHTNDFDQNDDEDEDFSENTVWLVDQTYDITALTFDETGKQVYMAVDHDKLATIYRIGDNLRQSNHYAKKVAFDSNNELYKSFDEKFEYLTIDWLTQNLYVLARNKQTLQQSIFLLDLRTRKRLTIVKNQHIQPSILLIDPVKTELYWISHNSPSVLNIGNLEGEIKKRISLSSTDSNVSYLSYEPISHEIIYVVNSNIYGLNTLDYHRSSPRLIYDHSSRIENALLVYPILYFTNGNNQADSTTIQLHAINIVAKSFAKNIAKFKDFSALKFFIDMAPTMPTATIINRCASNPCSDICIPLEHERFRCVCGDDARYQSCTCPTGEKFVAGSCEAKNGQCEPGRVLCQNLLNCAESARICEQDHTQYTEAFKSTARCTLDQPNDGFDCYYPSHGTNNTCIPFEWLCDGFQDCPLGNDEEHCHKLTTTVKPIILSSSRCLTENKFTHVMCGNQCLKIGDVCRNTSNSMFCKDEFHLHCKQTKNKTQYDCKCQDDQNRCIAMTEECDDFESCEQICQVSIHLANSKANRFLKSSSITWIILVVAILGILVVAIIVMTLRYRRQKKNPTKAAVPSRTPAVAETANSPSKDTRELLLNNGSNVANETS